MSNKITIKRSAVPGKVPEPGDLEYGEFAINYADGNLFFKNSSNTVTTLASTQFVSVTGNVQGGNIVTAGQVTATGNISGNYFIGNGSQLTGLPEGYGNADVAAYLPTYTGNLVSLTGAVTTTANISGNYFIGNGSQLTGISGGDTIGGTFQVIARGGSITITVTSGFFDVTTRSGTVLKVAVS